MEDVIALTFGIVFIVIGLSITVKMRSVKWSALKREIFEFTSDQDGHLKWLGAALIAVGIIMIVSAFRTV